MDAVATHESLLRVLWTVRMVGRLSEGAAFAARQAPSARARLELG